MFSVIFKTRWENKNTFKNAKTWQE